MKKMVLKVPLQHKAESFEPEICVVEKVVLLRHQLFEEMRANPLRDSPYIAENNQFMWCDAKSEHCVLFLDCEGEDGLLVQSEGYSYARRSQFIPGAKNLVYAAEMTTAEQRIHGYLADMVEEAAKQMHRGEESFSFRELGEEVTSHDLEDMLGQALAERLQDRADVESAEYAPIGIDYQPDLRVKPKELYTMRLITPLQIEAVSDDDFEAPYTIDPQEATGCRDAINRFMQDYLEEDERDRGLMQYYDSRSPVSEKIWSAFPSVEVVDGRLMGVLTCQFTEPLSKPESAEFCRWWRGQRSDGYGEGLEQHPINTEKLVEIYVSLWDGTDDCRMELNAADFGEEAPEIGGMTRPLSSRQRKKQK